MIFVIRIDSFIPSAKYFQVTTEKDEIDKADSPARNISSGGWKPLAKGIRLEKYARRRKKSDIKDADKDTADDRVDIETSDNLQYLSITKPDKAIKLEPLEVRKRTQEFCDVNVNVINPMF